MIASKDKPDLLPFEKAVLFLYVQNPPKPIVGDQQIRIMANLCFGRDINAAKAALEEARLRGFADSNDRRFRIN